LLHRHGRRSTANTAVLVGMSALGRLLVGVFVDRGRIRIISTRRATPFERHEHEEARR
jgi:uncharacterized DUF497 family protein